MAKPTMVYDIFEEQVGVYIFGKSPHDLSEQEVIRIARNLNVAVLYHPNTSTFNAKVCGARSFTQRFEIDGKKVCSGCLTDGVVLASP